MEMQDQQAQPPAPPAEEGQDIKALIGGIGQGMEKFQELLSAQQEVPEQLKAKLAAISQGYQDFVIELSNGGAQAPEAQPQAPQEPGPQGAVPVGVGAVPSSGGPGAIPRL